MCDSHEDEIKDLKSKLDKSVSDYANMVEHLGKQLRKLEERLETIREFLEAEEYSFCVWCREMGTETWMKKGDVAGVSVSDEGPEGFMCQDCAEMAKAETEIRA